MTAYATITTSAADGVFTITLNRPDALNALNEPMSVELRTALRTAQREDDLRCVVLTGAGRAFCAGQDLKELAAGQDQADAESRFELGAVLRQRYNPIILRMRTMEKPVIAAVNGVAAGGGTALALAADLRICTRQASFMLAFVHVGLVPDMGSTLALVQQVGYARAAELSFLGESLPAEEALRWGLVNRVVDDDQLEATVHEMASKLAAAPTRAIGMAKRALNKAWGATLDEQLEYEAFLQSAAAQTADHHEGVQAFLNKRKPKFTGS